MRFILPFGFLAHSSKASTRWLLRISSDRITYFNLCTLSKSKSIYPCSGCNSPSWYVMIGCSVILRMAWPIPFKAWASLGWITPLLVGGTFSSRVQLLPTEPRYSLNSLRALLTVRSSFLDQNQPLRMDTSTSAGYQIRSRAIDSTLRLPRSSSILSSFFSAAASPSPCWLFSCVFSASARRAGTTQNSLLRVLPPSLPTQRTSGPQMEISASGCSLRIRA